MPPDSLVSALSCRVCSASSLVFHPHFFSPHGELVGAHRVIWHVFPRTFGTYRVASCILTSAQLTNQNNESKVLRFDISDIHQLPPCYPSFPVPPPD